MVKEDMTFADDIRVAVKSYRGGEFKVSDLADKMNLNKKMKKRLYNILGKMHDHTKEVERVQRGVYRYVGYKKTPLEQVAWRILRARTTVSISDLVELAGMSEEYARKWLKSFEGQGIVKCINRSGGKSNIPKVWRLMHDSVAMPVNKNNRERHRRRKEKRLAAMKKIEDAEKALIEARELLTDGGEADV